jgi:hypothetical protein
MDHTFKISYDWAHLTKKKYYQKTVTQGTFFKYKVKKDDTRRKTYDHRYTKLYNIIIQRLDKTEKNEEI